MVWKAPGEGKRILCTLQVCDSLRIDLLSLYGLYFGILKKTEVTFFQLLSASPTPLAMNTTTTKNHHPHALSSHRNKDVESEEKKVNLFLLAA